MRNPAFLTKKGLFCSAGLLTMAFAFVACSNTTSATTDDEEEISSSSSKAKSSSSNVSGSSSSSAADTLAEDCIGEAGVPWDGTTAKEFACGAGTKLSPYIILTAEQLAHFSFIISSNDTDYDGKYFKLGADIILNDGNIIDEKGALVADSTKLHKWTPAGNSSVTFSGNFDGNGHSISGMFVSTTSTHNGLFGNAKGTIQNFILKNSWVHGGNYTGGIAGVLSGTVKGVETYVSVESDSDYVGGIVGFAKGESSGTAYIKGSKNFGVVRGRDQVGGVAGSAYSAEFDSLYNYGDIEGRNIVGGISGRAGFTYVSTYLMSCKKVENHADITGKNYIGGIFGIAGYSSPSLAGNSTITTIDMAKNNGSIVGEKYVGGIIGSGNQIKISRALNLVKVEGQEYVAGLAGNLVSSTSESMYNMGSIVAYGHVGGVIGSNSEGVTSSAYSTGKVDGDSLVGLMIGYNYNTTMADYYYLDQGEQEPFGLNNGGGVATPKTADEMKSQDFAELLGEDFVYDSGLNDGYPVLGWERASYIN